MTRGLGWVQRECLRIIEKYAAAGHRPTTFNLAADIYRVKRDGNGTRLVNEAQHRATMRALSSLRRKGIVAGQQDIIVSADGRRMLSQVGADGMRAERCCRWSLLPVPRATQ